MFGSNPFVSSFAPQQGWGQNNAWSSGGSQNWGGNQPWSTSNGSVNSSQQSTYNPYGSGYGYQTPTTDTYGQNNNGGGYQTPTVDYYNQNQQQQNQQNPYYSQNPYGMSNPYSWTQGSYGPNGWIPQGSMPPWMNGSNPPTQPPQNNGGNTVGRNGGLTGPYSNQTQTASTFPTEPSPDNSVANTFNPPQTQQQPPWSTTMMPNWANTNNPNAYMQAPNHPQFVPDIIARMMYAQKGYTGNNGLYINPDGSITF